MFSRADKLKEKFGKPKKESKHILNSRPDTSIKKKLKTIKTAATRLQTPKIGKPDRVVVQTNEKTSLDLAICTENTVLKNGVLYISKFGNGFFAYKARDVSGQEISGIIDEETLGSPIHTTTTLEDIRNNAEIFGNIFNIALERSLIRLHYSQDAVREALENQPELQRLIEAAAPANARLIDDPHSVQAPALAHSLARGQIPPNDLPPAFIPPPADLPPVLPVPQTLQCIQLDMPRITFVETTETVEIKAVALEVQTKVREIASEVFSTELASQGQVLQSNPVQEIQLPRIELSESSDDENIKAVISEEPNAFFSLQVLGALEIAGYICLALFIGAAVTALFFGILGTVGILGVTGVVAVATLVSGAAGTAIGTGIAGKLLFFSEATEEKSDQNLPLPLALNFE